MGRLSHQFWTSAEFLAVQHNQHQSLGSPTGSSRRASRPRLFHTRAGSGHIHGLSAQVETDKYRACCGDRVFDRDEISATHSRFGRILLGSHRPNLTPRRPPGSLAILIRISDSKPEVLIRPARTHEESTWLTHFLFIEARIQSRDSC
jgi:hypothetical protein